MAKNGAHIPESSTLREGNFRKHIYFRYSEEEEEHPRKRRQRVNRNGRETASEALTRNLEHPRARAVSSLHHFNAFRESTSFEQSNRTEYSRVASSSNQLNEFHKFTRSKDKNHGRRGKSIRTEYPPVLSRSNKFNPFREWTRSKEKSNRRWEELSGTEYQREWTYSARDLSTCSDRFVVVCYNILGVNNASKHPDLYAGIPRESLAWKQRKRLICEEIHHYGASILCFQEVDRFDDLSISLQKDGFRGVFKGRTGDAVDGCATFWKEEQFTIVHQENIEFNNFGLRENVALFCILKMKHTKEESSLSTELPSRQHVILMFYIYLVLLKSSFDNDLYRIQPDGSRHVLIGNIHVLFNPKRGDIKLGQVRLFVEKAYKLSEKWGGIPVILGGDLNSLPESALYQFLASSELDIRLHDRKNISGQIENSFSSRGFNPHTRNLSCRGGNPISRPVMHTWSDEELKLATGGEGISHLQHQFELFSAYLGIPGSYMTRHRSGEPVATSFHSQFMGTCDYIWHTKDVVPVRVLETLPIDILRQTGGLPSKTWGSDHLALVCEFGFCG